MKLCVYTKEAPGLWIGSSRQKRWNPGQAGTVIQIAEIGMSQCRINGQKVDGSTTEARRDLQKSRRALMQSWPDFPKLSREPDV